ncbi:MAG: restriction endonuclease subunit S, partial [Bacteroidales bacterium]|nr:restriction endonuclease subunit S [Bacteroidales bacterium]
MQKYSSYKDSGVKWLGQIPEHWEVRKMKYAFEERSEKGFPSLPLLAATQNHGVIKKENYENRTVEATKSLDSLKLVEVGDFVISLRSFQGGIEISYDRGIISPAYTVLRPTHIGDCYFKYLGKSPIFIQLLKSMVTGIREGQNIDYS